MFQQDFTRLIASYSPEAMIHRIREDLTVILLEPTQSDCTETKQLIAGLLDVIDGWIDRRGADLDTYTDSVEAQHYAEFHEGRGD